MMTRGEVAAMLRATGRCADVMGPAAVFELLRRYGGACLVFSLCMW
jgi:hypothetical protein